MPCPLRLPFLCLIGLLALPCARAVDSAAPAWDAKTQGGFVVSLAHDRQGNVWAGTEDNGVSRYDPRTRRWTQFTTKDGLGDDDIYALACDLRGRVWAGTGRHGVSVWNGKAWKAYDRLTGPLGAHVTALAVNPVDGSVWGATEAGLFRYAHDRWTYFTRAEGLPSDQVTALAFSKAGALYVGTACDGLAIGSPEDQYHAWRRVTGPEQMPDTPSGRKLPSNLVNALLVAKDGTVYVGTDDGLAWSRDEGDVWHYVRGGDYADKLKGLSHPRPPAKSKAGDDVTADLLAEDYVTALSQDAEGNILVGHRQKGVEALDPNTGKRVSLTAGSAGDYIFALLPVGQAVLVGRYGGGLAQIGSLPASPATAAPQTAQEFPAPAQPPTAAALQSLTRRVQALHMDLSVGGAGYLGEDRVTQGDWTGRYGRQYALLCAMQSPWGDHLPIAGPYYAVSCKIGPHHAGRDSLRSWVHWVKTDNPKSLYDPEIGYRRQAEHDDHAETYVGAKGSLAYEGPDLWYTIDVPAGVYRLSLYLVNKDGHDGTNRYRDYLIQVKPYREKIEDADALPDLAHARVHNFWGGVYQQFVVRGSSKFYVKVAKNNSLNTLCSGVFIDKLQGGISKAEDMQTVWLGVVRYDPPDVGGQRYSAMLTAARTLWSALEATTNDLDGLPLQTSYRIQAYRAARTDGGSSALLANWRWQSHLWDEQDRQDFVKTMARAYQSALDLHPQLKALKD